MSVSIPVWKAAGAGLQALWPSCWRGALPVTMLSYKWFNSIIAASIVLYPLFLVDLLTLPRSPALCAVSAVGAQNAHCPRHGGETRYSVFKDQKESPLMRRWAQLSCSHLHIKELSTRQGNYTIPQSCAFVNLFFDQFRKLMMIARFPGVPPVPTDRFIVMHVRTQINEPLVQLSMTWQ